MGDNNERLAKMEAMLQANMEQAAKNKRITAIGSTVVILVLIIFGAVLYNKVTNFDVNRLQQILSQRAPAILQAQSAVVGDDLVKQVVPQARQQLTARIDAELPKLRQEFEKQLDVMKANLEPQLRGRLLDEISAAVKGSLASEVRGMELTEAEINNIDLFVNETISYLTTDIKPTIQKQAVRMTDQLDEIGTSLQGLKNSELGRQLKPASAEDATYQLVKSLAKLLVMKLEEPTAKDLLQLDMDMEVKDLFQNR